MQPLHLEQASMTVAWSSGVHVAHGTQYRPWVFNVKRLTWYQYLCLLAFVDDDPQYQAYTQTLTTKLVF